MNTPKRVRFILAAATCGIATLAATWITVAAITATHGLDHTDEGFYLLSYRWWRTELRTFTGAQYLYGPVFEAFGYHVVALRWFRLGTIVAAHAALGWQFMAWLRTRRPHAPTTWWWNALGAALVVASGGMCYSWLPATPGYNDISLLGAFMLLALAFRVDRAVSTKQPVRIWWALLAGPVIVAMVLAKWASAALSIGVIAIVVLIVLAARGWRMLVQFGAAIVTAMAGSVLLLNLFVPLQTAIGTMLATNALVAQATNSPTRLLSLYLSTTQTFLIQAARILWPVFLLTLGLRFARTTTQRRWMTGATGLGIAWVLVTSRPHWHGGTTNYRSYLTALVVFLLLPLDISLAATPMTRQMPKPWRMPSVRLRSIAMVAALVAIPWTTAAGTGNALLIMAANGTAAWMCVLIWAVTRVPRHRSEVYWLNAICLGALTSFITVVACSAQLYHPYRTDDYRRTTTATTLPALDGITLSPTTAATYDQLARTLQPYLSEPGRPIVAYDTMAGYVFALTGRSVGEAWYSASDHRRSAAGITAACQAGPPERWQGRMPIILTTRTLEPDDVTALATCGARFPADYQQLPSVPNLPHVQIYVPAQPSNERQ